MGTFIPSCAHRKAQQFILHCNGGDVVPFVGVGCVYVNHDTRSNNQKTPLVISMGYFF